MIEEEFYDGEDYKDFIEFKAKAYAYGLYFNFKRKNRYKGRKTPVEIPEESGSSISPQVINLPPIILNNYLDNYIKSSYHAGLSDKIREEFSWQMSLWYIKTDREK
jgi:hypothetical protein